MHGRKDLLIAISFNPYAPRDGGGRRGAKERKARIIAITDSRLSPIAARRRPLLRDQGRRSPPVPLPDRIAVPRATLVISYATASDAKAKRRQRSDRMHARFTLIGAGRIGRIHAAQHRAPSAAPRSLTSRDADARPRASLAQQLAREDRRSGRRGDATRDVDAVLIASSTDTHADWIERCAARRQGRASARSRSTSMRARQRVRASGAGGRHSAATSASTGATTRRSCA